MGLQLSIGAAALAVLLTATGCGGTSPAAAPPPPLAEASYSLWLSASRVNDKEPTELVAALVNHNGPDATFGVAASIDRWDGEEWVPHRRLVMCLDHWFCTAEPQGLDEEFAVPLIGLGARVGAAGPAERFTTKGLARGWYRISQTAHEGFVAAALLQVVDGVGQIAPLVPLGEPAISIAPALVAPAGATVHLSPWCRGATVRSLSAMSSAR